MTVHAKTLDLRAEGCSAVVEEPLIDGMSCTFTIFCNCDGKPEEITATGKLMYSTLSGMVGYRIGIHFGFVNPANKELISKVIARSY